MLGQKGRLKEIDGQHRTAWASWLGQFSCPLRNMLHTFWVEGGNGRETKARAEPKRTFVSSSSERELPLFVVLFLRRPWAADRLLL